MTRFIIPISILIITLMHGCKENTTMEQSDITLIEKVTKADGEIVIPYSKYKLANGLTILISEDNSDPVVHVDVTYHVGSSREEIGRSGFAHFYEHMMFQGSDNVADDEHFKIVQACGGIMNGSTNMDRTNYYETVPNNQLEVALWLEADRMGFFLDAVTQEKFEIQRATVKNERNQRYDNKPYGLVYEKINAALYPHGHPYSWPTIGYIPDLNKADLEDLKKFFLRWYGPNNATLTIAGDVNTNEVLDLVKKYFAPINIGPKVDKQIPVKVELAEDRYISYEDRVRFPLFAMVFPTIEGWHEDEPALDVLSDILGGGKNSIFYKNFIKSQIAVQANVSHPCKELGGQFFIRVYAYPDKPLSEIESLVRRSIAEFEERGINEDDITRFKATYESGNMRSLESVSGKASTLAMYETFQGNPNQIKGDLDRYASVTKEDVMRAYHKYIKNQHAVILSVYPNDQKEKVARPDNYEITLAQRTDSTDAYEALVYNKPEDSFDRSIRPGSGANPVIKVPEIWKETFENGLQIIGTTSDEIPMITMKLYVEAGHRNEPVQKAGLAYLTAKMLNESTQNYTPEEIAAELEKIGSKISVRCQDEDIVVTVNSMVKNTDRTLELVNEMIFKPAFDKLDFDRVKAKQLEDIANQKNDAGQLANLSFDKILYGKGHIMAIPPIGKLNTVTELTLEDVKGYYHGYISPTIAKLVVVGDMTKEQVISKINFLSAWEPREVTVVEEPLTPEITRTRVFLVNKEGAPQSEIRIGYLALPYDATGEYYKATLMNFNLGGIFSSRVNLNLREDKGWTYGARSHFSGTKHKGSFNGVASVKASATDSSVYEFISEFKNYAENGITNEELEFLKSSIGQKDALSYETPGQKTYFLKKILDYNLETSYIDERNAINDQITQGEINLLAKKYLPVDKMAIVVVGDRKQLRGKLKNLGYEVVDMKIEL